VPGVLFVVCVVVALLEVFPEFDVTFELLDVPDVLALEFELPLVEPFAPLVVGDVDVLTAPAFDVEELFVLEPEVDEFAVVRC
jgi:hypothetical protein